MDIAYRTNEPRIKPLRLDEWQPELASLASGGRAPELGAPQAPVLNVLATIANHPALATRYDQTQLMDLVFVVGNYTMISMALNSFGVQLEDKYR